MADCTGLLDMLETSSIFHYCFFLSVVVAAVDVDDEEKEDYSHVCSNVSLLLSTAAVGTAFLLHA